MAFRFETANERWSWYRGVEPSDNDEVAGLPREDKNPGEANQTDVNSMIRLFEYGQTPRQVFDLFAQSGGADNTPLPRFDEIQAVYDKWNQDRQQHWFYNSSPE